MCGGFKIADGVGMDACRDLSLFSKRPEVGACVHAYVSFGAWLSMGYIFSPNVGMKRSHYVPVAQIDKS